MADTDPAGLAYIGYQVMTALGELNGLEGTVDAQTFTTALSQAKNVPLPAAPGITFTCDGKERGKIGLNPSRAKSVLGSFSASVPAKITVAITGLNLDATVLSYAPGGFAEMSLIGLALGIEIAMVATHHLFRLFLILMTPGYFYVRALSGAEKKEGP